MNVLPLKCSVAVTLLRGEENESGAGASSVGDANSNRVRKV